jgi:hypothetical protein
MLFLFFSILSIIHTTLSFDETLIQTSVNLAQSTYCVTSIDHWNCTTCESSNILEYVVENRGALALLGYNTEFDTLFVSFRGSSNIENWIDDFQIMKTYPYENPEIAVELGFYKAYNYIKPDIFSNLEILSRKYKTNRILTASHSLGAAESTLFVYDIMKYYKTTYQLYYLITFGSPRVGNPDFVSDFASFNPSMYRITHYYDIVPHTPEELMGFLHLPNEVWYNENNTNYKICNDSDEMEDNTCSDSCAPIHCTSTSDHLFYVNIHMGSNNC